MEAIGPHDLTAAYALHALDEQDARAFEQHLRTCARCRDELAALEDTAAALGVAAGDAAPPPALRERILDRARAERSSVVPLRRPWVPRAAAAAAALAACAAIGLGVWAATLHRNLDDTRSALDEARTAAAILSDPTAQRSQLRGAEGTLVVAGTGRAVLAVTDIPPAPSGKTYEIWVIRGRMPERAGLFRDEGTVVLDRPVPEGATVGVTVERAGGVDAPTSTPRITAQA